LAEKKLDCPSGRLTTPRVRGNDEGVGTAAPPWVAEFLAGLIVTGSVLEAVAEAGIDFETAWALRRTEPAFEMYWDRAVRVHRRVMEGAPFLEAVGDEEVRVH
jgi:hypothetical protein